MSSGDDAAPVAALADAETLAREIAWLGEILHARLGSYFQSADPPREPRTIAPPAVEGDGSALAQAIRDHRFGWAERAVLALALAPHVQPQLLDVFFMRNANIDRGFTEFGGWKGKVHSGFLPTRETAAFLVAGADLGQRAALRGLFDDDHVFARRNILRLEHDAPGEPFFSGPLVMTSEGLALFTTGELHKPDFNSSFPAKRIATRLSWDDLVVGPEVMAEIDTLLGWIRHGRTLMEDWELARSLQPGYRSLFFGPPGTGKTLTAALIGQAVGADVYRIDLSMIVSKYIGETEKNLAQVFDQAAHRDWILFFDEADALFGKRTATSSSNDRYANQEVSYLLQRVEDFPGNVILATNLKGNIDEAFARRFQSLVNFPMPDAEQRLRLWTGMLRRADRLEPALDLRALAERYELSGGAIANVIRYGAIRAVQTGREHIRASDLARGAVRELRKEGRTA